MINSKKEHIKIPNPIKEQKSQSSRRKYKTNLKKTKVENKNVNENNKK